MRQSESSSDTVQRRKNSCLRDAFVFFLWHSSRRQPIAMIGGRCQSRAVWNDLPPTIRASPGTLRQFQSTLKTILFCSAYGTRFGAFVTVWIVRTARYEFNYSLYFTYLLTYFLVTSRRVITKKVASILASCLINAQPLPVHRPAVDDNSLIDCTGDR